jgi:hypothetical protein
MGEKIRTWEEEDFALELFSTNRTNSRGQTQLGYKFYCDGALIFKGEDFAGSPLHADDSDETVAALLNFLSLQPGDTDADYFENYTAVQMAFAEERGETLSLYAHDLEERAELRRAMGEKRFISFTQAFEDGSYIEIPIEDAETQEKVKELLESIWVCGSYHSASKKRS